MSSILTKEINLQEIAISNDMIQSAISHKINDIDNILLLASMNNKILIVARSKISKIDVREIITKLGDREYSNAASTAIKNKNLIKTEQFLIDIFDRKVKHLISASNVMSFPTISIKANLAYKNANLTLIRYNINTNPVVSQMDN